MSEKGDIQIQIDRMAELAHGFAYRQMYAEAAEMLGLALRLAPDDQGLRRELDRIRRAQRRAQPASTVTLRDTAREEFRRSSIDGSHYLGLARLYHEKGQPAKSIECIELAKERAPAHPGPHKLHGELLLAQGDLHRAAEQLERALFLDPFDRDTAGMLVRAEYGRREREKAIAAAVHAFLLERDTTSAAARWLRRRILGLKGVLGWGNDELLELFRRRRGLLEGAFDRLEWHRRQLLEEAPSARGKALFGTPPHRKGGGSIELAARLRRLGAWPELTDEQIFHLTQALQEEFHEPGSLVFTHGSYSRDIFIVERGEVAIHRPTPYGTFRLGELPPGEMFGEMGFLSHKARSGDAVAGRACQLLRFDGGELDRLLEAAPALAVELYWGFWHSLAAKLRRTNQQLLGFFADNADGDGLTAMRLGGEPEAARLRAAEEVADDTKIQLFAEQGLSHHELATLATYAGEQRIEAGEMLFREGDEGDTMYVLVEGKVRISKQIPGAGEEALAILDRGELFGEMALIDGQPRSADAIAHDGPVTVLTLGQDTVAEVLKLEPEASLEFLQLLCRLMTRRLLEVDQKVVNWRILAGDQSELVATG